MDIDLLVKLTSRAWSLTILSSLHRGVPGRQSRLLTASGAGRTAFAQSLVHLFDLGLLERNPGHGHPLRPEFRLTDMGKIAAALADRVLAGTQEEDLPVMRRAWTVPVLSTLSEPRHFGEIGACLPRITDRALSQSLQLLETRHWISREVDDTSRPPRALYRAVARGDAICRAVAAEVGALQGSRRIA